MKNTATAFASHDKPNFTDIRKVIKTEQEKQRHYSYPLAKHSPATFNLELGRNGFHFSCFIPRELSPPYSSSSGQVLPQPQQRTEAMAPPLEPFPCSPSPADLLSTFPPLLQSLSPSPAQALEPKPMAESKKSAQPATLGRHRSQTIDLETQEVRDMMSEIRRLGKEMGCSPKKESRRRKETGIPTPVKTRVGGGNSRKVIGKAEGEDVVASPTSTPKPRRHVQFRGGYDHTARAGAGSSHGERVLSATVSHSESSARESGTELGGKASLRLNGLNESSAGSRSTYTRTTKVAAPMLVTAMENEKPTARLISLRPSELGLSKVTDGKVESGKVASSLPPPLCFPGAFNQTQTISTGESIDPRKDFAYPLISKSKDTSESVRISPSPTPAQSIQDTAITSKSSSQSKIPEKNIGTPPATRRAIEEEMQRMCNSLRQSIGPSYFRQRQANTSDFPSPKGGPELRDTSTFTFVSNQNIRQRTMAVNIADKSSTKEKGGVTSTRNSNSGLRKRIVGKKPSQVDLPATMMALAPQAGSGLPASTMASTDSKTMPTTPAKPTPYPRPTLAPKSFARGTRKTVFSPTASIGPVPSTYKSTLSVLSRGSRTAARASPPGTISKIDSKIPSPRPQEPQTAGAEDISAFITKLHARDKHLASASVSPSSHPRTSTPPGTPLKATSTTNAPPGHVTHLQSQAPASFPSTRTSLPPTTPLPKRRRDLKGDRTAICTPSREIQSSLNVAIDRQIDSDAKAGQVFTPSGNRISELLERRKSAETD